MLTTHGKPPATAGEEADVRAWRLLARKSSAMGVRVALVEGSIEIASGDPNGQQLMVRIPAVKWQVWQSERWVALGDPSPKGEMLWRLTAKGRQQARRELSGGRAVPLVHVHATVRQSAARPSINPHESPIAWLASRRDKSGQPMISSEQFAAAERLRADFWFAGLSPNVTTNWSAAALGGGVPAHGTATDMSDNRVAAGVRMSQALAAAGPEFQSILMDVCCYLIGLEDVERKSGWPPRSGKVVLQLALTRLARHYGIIAPAAKAHTGKPRIRQWGAEGYRPDINASDEPR